MSRAGLAEAVRVATGRPTGRGSGGAHEGVGAVVRLFGSIAGVVYHPDEVEVARRAAEQPDAVTRLDTLNMLMGLPMGAPVAVEDLSGAERALLRTVPRGAVVRDGALVVRRAVAPISVRLAVVAARDWRTGLRVASRFAPYCARSMLLSAYPDDWEQAEMRAAYFGVGVIVLSRGAVRTVIEPDPYVRRRHTPAQWWFAEETWRQIRVCGSAADEPAAPEPTG